jgi:hypothetical protein
VVASIRGGSTSNGGRVNLEWRAAQQRDGIVDG